MTQLYTKKQRHTIYKKLLKLVCADPDTSNGLCYYLKMLAREDYYYPFGVITVFPELNKYKPEYGFFSWQRDGEIPLGGSYFLPPTYKGWETRIKWIVQAIKDTK